MKKLILFTVLLQLSNILFAQPDALPPVLVNITINPQVVDVSNAQQTVIITFEATDNLTGVSIISPTISYPNGNGYNTSASLTSGTNLNGIWTFTLPVPQGMLPGTAFINSVYVSDNAGNYTVISNSQLMNQGFDTDFEIINTNPDSVPPSIVNITISPQVVDVSNSQQTVIITFEVTDNITGASIISPTITFPNGNGYNSSASLTSGTNLNGIWTFTLPVSQGTLPGMAFINSVYLSDNAGNYAVISNSQLMNQGYDTDFEIINNNPDAAPPVLVNITINPQVVDVSNSSQTVIITFEVTDNITGASIISPTIIFPNGNGYNTSASLTSGTNLNGIWTFTLPVPQGTLPGMAFINSVYISDNAGNYTVISNSQLMNQGFDTDFEIIYSNLPITYFNLLDAKSNQNKVDLRWSLANQTNNDKFIIEHSKDGRIFSQFGEISGDGTSNEIKHYEYTHTTPSIGMNYYRIKQVDYDGKYSYSNLAGVGFYGDTNTYIYPNPATSEVTITTAEQTSVQIMDVYGKLLTKQDLSEGQNTINISGLHSGIHIFLVGDHRFKVLKQ